MLRKLIKCRSALNLLQLKKYPNHEFIYSSVLSINSERISCSIVTETKTVIKENESNKDHNTSEVQCLEKMEPIKEMSTETERRLKVLQLEIDIARQEGKRVPSLDRLTDKHWNHILTLSTKSARMKYYAYLWQIQIKKANREKLKEQKVAAGIEIKNKVLQERAENDHIIYGLGHCSMFLRIYDTTIMNWMNNKLIRAMQFSPKIVLDCSYDNEMNRRESENTAKQLTLCFAENRLHDDPFDIHFCNVNLNGMCMKSLQRMIPTMLNPEFPMNIHEKCFTELFPKQNLVYLTPHCRTDLIEYNPDDIYIIGAIVDTGDSKPLSLAKAKRLGLRMARFPLDRYLQWGSGSGKSLTLNQVTKILLDLRETGDWVTALQHVPKRKLGDLTNDTGERMRQSFNKRAAQLNLNLKDILLKHDTCNRPLNAVHSFKDTTAQMNVSSTLKNKKTKHLNLFIK